MIKKKPNQPQTVLSKFHAQQSFKRNQELKKISSPSRKVSVVSSRVKATNKNPSSIQTIKSETQKQSNETALLSRNKNKVNIQNIAIPQAGVKQIKKATSPIPSSKSIKRFSKTSKIPTLKSSSVKQTEKQKGQIEKSQQNSEKYQQKQDNLLQLTISTLKQEIYTLKTQNDELKKQNQKLNKKVQKFKSLNDDKKKTLKQKIQSFTYEGDILRKLKQQISKLNKNIQGLQQNVTRLEQDNKFLKNSTQKLASSKEQKQIQTQIIQVLNKKEQIEQSIDLNSLNSKKQYQQKNYYSSSSRKSYGGILPIQTVYDLNDSRKMNFRTAQSTPNKDTQMKQKLLKKYDNYWSVKLGKCDEIQNTNEFSYQLNLQVKSECPDIGKEQLGKNIQPLQNLSSRESKIKQGYKNISPTMLIEKYQKISQQQQLINSLYNIIEELSEEIQEVEETKIKLLNSNTELRIKITNLIEQNQELNRKIQQFMGTSIQFNLQQQKMQANDKFIELQNNQLNDETLLLDETREQKQKLQQQIKNVTGTLDCQKYQKDKIKVIKSAVERQLINEFQIMDEISKFFNSDVLCHCSCNSDQLVNNNQDKILGNNQFLQNQQTIKNQYNNNTDTDKQMILTIDKSIVRIQDSLQVMQYFSTHTPINLSSQVSLIQTDNDDQIKTNFNHYNNQQEKLNKTYEQPLKKQNSYLHDVTTNPVNFSIA